MLQEQGAVGFGKGIPDLEPLLEDRLQFGRSALQQRCAFFRAAAEQLLEMPVEVGGLEALFSFARGEPLVFRQARAQDLRLGRGSGGKGSGLVGLGQGQPLAEHRYRRARKWRERRGCRLTGANQKGQEQASEEPWA